MQDSPSIAIRLQYGRYISDSKQFVRISTPSAARIAELEFCKLLTEKHDELF
jgi:hypothetical protein